MDQVFFDMCDQYVRVRDGNYSIGENPNDSESLEFLIFELRREINVNNIILKMKLYSILYSIFETCMERNIDF